MDNTVDPAVEVVALRDQLSTMRTMMDGLHLECSVLKKLASIDALEMKRLKREVEGLRRFAPTGRATERT